MYDLKLQKINLKNEEEKNEVYKFLESFGLILDKDVDYTVVFRDGNNAIKATCSKAKNIFKCFAISEDIRGENITSSLISNLVDKLFEEGIYHSFLFTKPDKVKIFTSLNFNLIYKEENAALLEYGIYNINKALDKMIAKYEIDVTTEKGALVMNCNPFTNGHRYLVEEASKKCSEVIVFVVEEDKSLFPFKDRYSMVEEGLSDFKNVKVIPGSEYIISSATFPSYFIRKEDERLKSYENIDCNIFGEYFCKKLNIIKRFVGEEPYCNVTNTYNNTLKKVMPKYGVELIEIERKCYEGNYISASKVREFIKNNQMDQVKNIIPEVTWKFLNSNKGKEIREKIQKSNSPH
ncbi:citrate lyase ligase [Clostridium carboxidivorans P7]|uniref:[Citrate [pro-3S]-lyase] ligase n=1 Tax=Clostridium carboxidivorans P7 TaxID=536227 RepID=C6PZN8_9CLOT|nr:[citrate (pro-3S)-lyase] ligase [Clostridium carboxidivorans]AKN32930.1 citrate lyase ligase [Clostridium carboxidivorans P7]EET85279.1 citrate lyase ligase [Clostridium carboxidivorans P7]EFG89814.1 [citrate (pro-3S)-lyase] ligase [Clostridium carboxidivorans P7]